MSELQLDEYQRRTRNTAVYPGRGTGSAIALAYCGLGLGESGEVQGKIKKVIRDDGGHLTTDKRLAIADELGDLLWYIARLADEMECELSTIAARNLAKLESRKTRGVIGGSGDQR